jgi:hypothetical protein
MLTEGEPNLCVARLLRASVAGLVRFNFVWFEMNQIYIFIKFVFNAHR